MNTTQMAYYDLANALAAKGEYGKALRFYLKIEDVPEVWEIVGEYFYYGRGCAVDKSKAHEYFHKAAEAGLVDAMCNCALLAQDPAEKQRLYGRAAENGCAYAMNQMGLQMEQAGEAASAVQWYSKAAEGGESAGMYNYAMWTEDPKLCTQYLKAAADAGHLPSQEVYQQIRQQK